MMERSHRELLELTYTQLNRLRNLPNQFERLRNLGSRIGLPHQGVYLFLEDGEVRWDGTPRVVRVGTHAVSEGSRRTLWQRLSNHLGTRSGSGNHRGSIFRLHVGSSLSAKLNESLPSWGKGSSRPESVKSDPQQLQTEIDWERKVSETIGCMPVMWIDVPGPATKENERRSLESDLIAVFSNRRHPVDPPSPNWLGRHSNRNAIRESGLWNLDSIDGICSPGFEKSLIEAVERTIQRD